MIGTISIVVLAIGSLGTCAGAWYVYKTLKANHEQQRRQFAVDMICGWNVNTGEPTKAIEKVFPHSRHRDAEKKVQEITREQAINVYTCGPDDKDNWEIRFRIIELLNYLEFAATAYSQKIADPQIILRSFKGTMEIWHDVLKNFIDIVYEYEGYQPWQPFLDVVAKWRADDINSERPFPPSIV